MALLTRLTRICRKRTESPCAETVERQMQLSHGGQLNRMFDQQSPVLIEEAEGAYLRARFGVRQVEPVCCDVPGFPGQKAGVESVIRHALSAIPTARHRACVGELKESGLERIYLGQIVDDPTGQCTGSAVVRRADLALPVGTRCVPFVHEVVKL